MQLVELITLFFKNIFYTFHTGSSFDMYGYMKNFFDDYDAIDPNDRSVVPQGLIEDTIDFYTEKYFSEDWKDYTCPDWQAVIPQDLWEQVVRKRENFQQQLLPIKIQLKDGKRVDPYF